VHYAAVMMSLWPRKMSSKTISEILTNIDLNLAYNSQNFKSACFMGNNVYVSEFHSFKKAWIIRVCSRFTKLSTLVLGARYSSCDSPPHISWRQPPCPVVRWHHIQMTGEGNGHNVGTMEFGRSYFPVSASSSRQKLVYVINDWRLYFRTNTCSM